MTPRIRAKCPIPSCKHIRRFSARACLILALFLALPFFLGMGSVPALSPQEALLQTAEKEDVLLAQLRGMQLDMERKRAEADLLEAERASLLVELARLNQEQELVSQRHARYRSALAGILSSWQTAGPGSRLELLLSSDSLSVFLRRLSAMRQLDRDMSSLLSQLEASQAELGAGEARVGRTLEAVEQKGRQLAGTLERMRMTEMNLEASLTSLRAERSRYETMLAALSETWEQAMEVFPSLTRGFSKVIAEGAFPDDALEMTFDLSGITAVMRQERFQDILDNAEGLPPLTFSFNPEGVVLDVPDAELRLVGQFDIKRGVTLVFRPQVGTQGGLTLTEAQLRDLSRKGALEFQLEPILMGTTIQRVTPGDGFLRLAIRMLVW